MSAILTKLDAIDAKQETMALTLQRLESSMMTRAEIESALDRRVSLERFKPIEDKVNALPAENRANLGTVMGICAVAISLLSWISQHWH